MPGEVDKRGDGFEATCRNRGVPCDSLRIYDGDSLDLFEDFLHSHRKDGKLEIDGIFCVTDHLAWDVECILRRMGVRVPEDVQIIGFDGIRMFGDADYVCSSIAQPIQKLAETSVDILLAEDRTQLPAMVCLPVSYVSGRTTKD